MNHKMFWFFVQSLSKRDSWTSKMTTKMFWFFLHRAVEICDLRGKCFNFFCKARGNLWLKGPCTKPFPRGRIRLWVYICCSKPVEICDFKIFTRHPKWPRFDPVRPQWAAIQPSFFNLGQTLIFCAKLVEICDLRDRAQNLSPVVGCDFGFKMFC